MAAAVHGLGPDTDLERAITARIVNQALLWLGVSPEEIERSWEALMAGEREQQRNSRPTNDEVYDVLIRMIHAGSRVGADGVPEAPLFEGRGNWGVPGDPNRPACLPHYNSCRLTERGEQVARERLARHREDHSSAEQVAPPDRPRD
jgi:hypothetical protein